MTKQILKTILLVVVVASCGWPAQAASSDVLNVTTPTRVSVHDPSVVVGYKDGSGKITGEKTTGSTEVYYIFGSHRAWARCTDMQNWETFTNNLSTSYKSILSPDATWAAKGGTQGNSSYDVSGNMWAPDVIWNKKMQKWCMYMSVNGDNWYSSIVLLTAETLDGDWTRVGTVVYSGFTSTAQAKLTDFFTVYDGVSLPDRYVNGGGKYTLNAIDPCVFYDEDGNLWMTYGSWFGGLYMLRLDASTGLRDYTYTYETKGGTSTTATEDVYQGIKLAGGNGVSGEASYIQYINDRYYLFVTYGGLTAAGGYNMRVFQSKDVKGPYTDLGGRSAIYSTSNTAVGQLNRTIGIQLMNYYQWDTMSYGYCAEGHNSAMVDDDGKIYLVYHTRATTWGEGHEVRVHQMFTTEDGGLVAAPFEYRGETLSTSPYSTDEIAGTYKVIYHQTTDYANLSCNAEKTITLNADGTVTGDYSGTWSQSASGPQVTIDLGTSGFGGPMKGVFIKQKMEGLNYENLCFAVVGAHGRPVWGYKDVSDVVSEAVSELSGTTTSPIKNTLASYATGSAFSNATAASLPDVTETTGLSLSFYVSGLDSDWNQIAKSSDDSYIMYLSILHYNSADFYESLSTVSGDAKLLGYNSGSIWKAFVDGDYYATISFNPDGTISYYRNGTLMLTFAANTAPGWYDTSVSGSNSVTPASIVKAVINYYNNGQLEFIHSVYGVQVGYSVAYDSSLGIHGIESTPTLDANAPMYNLGGQRVGSDYRGIVIQNGKKIMKK